MPSTTNDIECNARRLRFIVAPHAALYALLLVACRRPFPRVIRHRRVRNDPPEPSHRAVQGVPPNQDALQHSNDHRSTIVVAIPIDGLACGGIEEQASSPFVA